MYNVYAIDIAMLVLRLVIGTFFVLARFRWVYDPTESGFVRGAEGEPQRIAYSGGTRWFNGFRRAHLEWKICHCGYGTHPMIAAAVAMTEIVGGLALIFGCLTSLAALGLLIVTGFATYCTAYDKTAKQKPVDAVDWVSCYLWNPEPHLLTGAFLICIIGPGIFSLDAVIWWLIA